MNGRIHIGTSGYVYAHWRNRFYPKGLPQRDWLPFYARHFDTVELNNPFYRLPEADQFQAWRDRVPAGFAFAVKASRFITHVKRLKDPGEPLALLLERARHLGPHLGPILFQLPATFHINLERLDALLLALEGQRQVKGLRAALEVRHPSWQEPEVIDRLERAGVALCIADWPEFPVRGPATAEFLYVRRHGARGRYGGLVSGFPARQGRARAPAMGREREGRLRLLQQRR